MLTIENESIRAGFVTKGAELRSLVEKKKNTEFLWQADSAFWAKSAPVLFPIIGALKDGKYHYGGREFSLGRHGFARDREFQVAAQTKDSLTFRLESDESSRAIYPFDWTLEIEYKIGKRVLQTTYRVLNRGTEILPFQIGAHPAFNVPFFPGESFEDYYLEFEQDEPFERHLLNSAGIQSGEVRPLPSAGRILMLSRPLLAEDAVILKKMRSARVTLKSKKTTVSVSVEFPRFPYFGVWSAPGAPFVCLEPWCGLADAPDADGNLLHKEGINVLNPGETFKRTFAITLGE